MYTRCPSCRAEISFEPPANMETLPDGYKHRIKCPSCGVTIGVKINKTDTLPIQQSPVQPEAFEPVYANDETAAKSVAVPKHSGIGRNITMMLLSLLFIAISVVGYLINNNTIKFTEGSELIKSGLFGITYFDGISMWNTLINNSGSIVEMFTGENANILGAIASLMPMLLFTLAGINFIVALVSACGKKYGRAYNVISSLLIGGSAIFAVFIPYLTGEDESVTSILEYVTKIVNDKWYVFFAALVLGLVQIILGLCFIKSLKRKQH